MERDAVLNLRVKRVLKDHLEADAKAKGVSVSKIHRRILAEYYERRE